MENIEGFCDGACKGNPGRGGWGCVYIQTTSTGTQLRWARIGGKRKTTNQEMELSAFFEILRLIPTGKKIKIYSDSMFVLKGLIKDGLNGFIDFGLLKKDVNFTGWLGSWKQNGWVKNDGKPIAHLQIWKGIVSECERHLKNGSIIEVQWVKGHSGIEGNDLADELANAGIPSI